MAKLLASFDAKGPFPVDRRLVFDTISNMIEFGKNEKNYLPDAYFTICIENNSFYTYNKEQSSNISGGWSKLTTGGWEYVPGDDYIVVDNTTHTLKLSQQATELLTKTIPTKVSELENDLLFITVSELSSYTIPSANHANIADSITETATNVISVSQIKNVPTDNEIYGVQNGAWKKIEAISDTTYSAGSGINITQINNTKYINSYSDISLNNGLLTINNSKLSNIK